MDNEKDNTNLTARALLDHLVDRVSTSGQKLYSDEIFNYFGLLYQLSKYKQLKCLFCDQAFRSYKNLTKHVNCIHGFKRRFMNDWSDHKAQASIVQQTPIKPATNDEQQLINELTGFSYSQGVNCITCDFCQKNMVQHFNKVSDLRVHQKQAHPHKLSMPCYDFFVLTSNASQPFLCNLCPRKFSLRRRLINHQKIFHLARLKLIPFTATELFVSSSDGTSMSNVIDESPVKDASPYSYEVLDDGAFSCSFCPAVYDGHDQLVQHQRQDHLAKSTEIQTTPVPTTTTPKASPSKSRKRSSEATKPSCPSFWRRAEEECIPGEPKCFVCGTSFDTGEILARHFQYALCSLQARKKCEESDGKVFTFKLLSDCAFYCCFCNKIFYSKNELFDHQKSDHESNLDIEMPTAEELMDVDDDDDALTGGEMLLSESTNASVTEVNGDSAYKTSYNALQSNSVDEGTALNADYSLSSSDVVDNGSFGTAREADVPNVSEVITSHSSFRHIGLGYYQCLRCDRCVRAQNKRRLNRHLSGCIGKAKVWAVSPSFAGRMEFCPTLNGEAFRCLKCSLQFPTKSSCVELIQHRMSCVDPITLDVPKSDGNDVSMDDCNTGIVEHSSFSGSKDAKFIVHSSFRYIGVGYYQCLQCDRCIRSQSKKDLDRHLSNCIGETNEWAISTSFTGKLEFSPNGDDAFRCLKCSLKFYKPSCVQLIEHRITCGVRPPLDVSENDDNGHDVPMDDGCSTGIEHSPSSFEDIGLNFFKCLTCGFSFRFKQETCPADSDIFHPLPLDPFKRHVCCEVPKLWNVTGSMAVELWYTTFTTRRWKCILCHKVFPCSLQDLIDHRQKCGDYEKTLNAVIPIVGEVSISAQENGKEDVMTTAEPIQVSDSCMIPIGLNYYQCAQCLKFLLVSGGNNTVNTVLTSHVKHCKRKSNVGPSLPKHQLHLGFTSKDEEEGMACCNICSSQITDCVSDMVKHRINCSKSSPGVAAPPPTILRPSSNHPNDFVRLYSDFQKYKLDYYNCVNCNRYFKVKANYFGILAIHRARCEKTKKDFWPTCGMNRKKLHFKMSRGNLICLACNQMLVDSQKAMIDHRDICVATDLPCGDVDDGGDLEDVKHDPSVFENFTSLGLGYFECQSCARCIYSDDKPPSSHLLSCKKVRNPWVSSQKQRAHLKFSSVDNDETFVRCLCCFVYVANQPKSMVRHRVSCSSSDDNDVTATTDDGPVSSPLHPDTPGFKFVGADYYLCLKCKGCISGKFKLLLDTHRNHCKGVQRKVSSFFTKRFNVSLTPKGYVCNSCSYQVPGKAMLPQNIIRHWMCCGKPGLKRKVAAPLPSDEPTHPTEVDHGWKPSTKHQFRSVGFKQYRCFCGRTIRFRHQLATHYRWKHRLLFKEYANGEIRFQKLKHSDASYKAKKSLSSSAAPIHRDVNGPSFGEPRPPKLYSIYKETDGTTGFMCFCGKLMSKLHYLKIHLTMKHRLSLCKEDIISEESAGNTRQIGYNGSSHTETNPLVLASDDKPKKSSTAAPVCKEENDLSFNTASPSKLYSVYKEPNGSTGFRCFCGKLVWKLPHLKIHLTMKHHMSLSNEDVISNECAGETQQIEPTPTRSVHLSPAKGDVGSDGKIKDTSQGEDSLQEPDWDQDQLSPTGMRRRLRHDPFLKNSCENNGFRFIVGVYYQCLRCKRCILANCKQNLENHQSKCNGFYNGAATGSFARRFLFEGSLTGQLRCTICGVLVATCQISVIQHWSDCYLDHFPDAAKNDDDDGVTAVAEKVERFQCFCGDIFESRVAIHAHLKGKHQFECSDKSPDADEVLESLGVTFIEPDRDTPILSIAPNGIIGAGFRSFHCFCGKVVKGRQNINRHLLTAHEMNVRDKSMDELAALKIGGANQRLSPVQLDDLPSDHSLPSFAPEDILSTKSVVHQQQASHQDPRPDQLYSKAGPNLYRCFCGREIKFTHNLKHHLRAKHGVDLDSEKHSVKHDTTPVNLVKDEKTLFEKIGDTVHDNVDMVPVVSPASSIHVEGRTLVLKSEPSDPGDDR